MIEHVLARARVASARSRSRSSSAIRPSRCVTALAEHAGPHVCGAGATARHRPCAPADRSRSSTARRGTLVLLSGDVPLLRAEHAAALVERTRRRRRRGDRADRASSTTRTATAASSGPAGRLHASSRSGTRRRPSARSARSTAASTRSRSTALFDALRSIAAENAQGEYYLPDLVAIYRRRGRGVETVDVDGRRRDPRHQQPHGAGGSEPNRETDEERRADGGRRHDRRSGDDLHRRRRGGRRRHGHPSRRVTSKGTTTIGAGCEIHTGVAHRRLADRRSRRRSSTHCVITDVDDRRRRARRAVRAPAPGVATSASGAQVGNFVELKKTVARRGLEGDAPRVSRRRDDRREGQHRRRHDHLQLRRRARSTRRSSRTARSSAATRSSSRRSRSARAPTSAAARRSARTCRPARSASAPASSATSRAGSNEEAQEATRQASEVKAD